MRQLTAVSRAATKAAQAVQSRDEAIRAAHPAATIRVIAKAAGLSSARVHQILHGR